MLSSARKLGLRVELPELRALVLRTGVEATIDFEVASLAGRLTGMHSDPADRMVVATALAYRATLLTADHAILDLPGGPRTVDARK